MSVTRLTGLKAPNVIARAEGPGMLRHKNLQGLKGRLNRRPQFPVANVPPLPGGYNFPAPVFPGLNPGLQHCGLSALTWRPNSA